MICDLMIGPSPRRSGSIVALGRPDTTPPCPARSAPGQGLTSPES